LKRALVVLVESQWLRGVHEAHRTRERGSPRSPTAGGRWLVLGSGRQTRGAGGSAPDVARRDRAPCVTGGGPIVVVEVFLLCPTRRDSDRGSEKRLDDIRFRNGLNNERGPFIRGSPSIAVAPHPRNSRKEKGRGGFSLIELCCCVCVCFGWSGQT
jgi:hypothetical protein